MVKAFEATGLHPFNPDAVNYKFCLELEKSEGTDIDLLTEDELRDEVNIVHERLMTLENSLEIKNRKELERSLEEIEFFERKLDQLKKRCEDIVKNSTCEKQG